MKVDVAIVGAGPAGGKEKRENGSRQAISSHQMARPVGSAGVLA
jgi:hypothetical protein